MNSINKTFILALCLVVVSGCASTRYEWNNYDTALYDHYKTPAEQVRFAEALQETILEGEAEGRVPPGIYAEYGFLLYEMGNSPMAIKYYQKEAEKWPESRVFMSKMIAVAQNRTKKKVETVKPADIPDASTRQGQTKPGEAAK